MTFDRKYKKDSFYAYKAWLSDEPFVHLCGKRYIDRVEDVTRVTVYSNQPAVELFANGESLGVKEAADHFFYFDVPNTGETRLTAVSGELKDESIIRKVDTFNEAYQLKEEGAVLNWFDVVEKPGRLSLNSKMGEVLATLGGKLIMLRLMGKMFGSGKKGGKKKVAGFEMTPDMMTMMNGFTVLRLLTMAGGMMNVKFTKEDLLKLNTSPENSNYNLKVAKAGVYNIAYNAYAKVIEITPAGQDDTVHIKGSFVDSWNIIDPATNLPSDDYKLVGNDGVYEITMTITEDMVANGATWQAGLMVNTTTGTDGEWIGVSCLGVDADDNVNALFRPASGNNLTCTTAGTYRITFDLATKTINIYKA